jgi:2-polyprenyl-3-methyl-5-hydroxy-6-metoxy-1,4-benzoquinol methylase
MISPLFALIPNHPGIYISIIEDENFDCVDELKVYADSIKATLHVNEFEFEQKRYNKHAIQYDFVFICAKIEHRSDILEIANKTYRVLKNAGHVFILSPKESTRKLSQFFEDSNFVAINPIPLNSEYDIISAKKMHGWMKV